MTAIVLSFDAAHYAETTEALRKAEVTSENKRSDWGRETLLGLFGKHMTEGDLTAALLAAFKPKKPNGKAGDTLSASLCQGWRCGTQSGDPLSGDCRSGDRWTDC
jgi:hypothetical protein